MLLIVSYTLGASAQFNPEIDALMAYVDSVQDHNQKYVKSSPSLSMFAQSHVNLPNYDGRRGEILIAFNSHIQNLSDLNSKEFMELNQTINRFRQVMERFSEKTTESYKWENHAYLCDTISYTAFLDRYRNDPLPNEHSDKYFFNTYITFPAMESVTFKYASGVDTVTLTHVTYDSITGTYKEGKPQRVPDFQGRGELRYSIMLDTLNINAIPLNINAYCEAIKDVFNAKGVTMRKVHYYQFECKQDRVFDGDTYGLHYIIQSKDIAHRILSNFWNATSNYCDKHPCELYSMYNYKKIRYPENSSPMLIFTSSATNSSWLRLLPELSVYIACSKGYYHILVLNADYYNSINRVFPKDWEIIKDYDNGEITYYEEDRR